MVMHTPKLTTPWYGGSPNGVMLHRYLDDQFMERFLREAQSNQLPATAQQAWLDSDKFDKDLVALRLPIHRTFYIACCEVSCDNLGLPAFDPARITSTGLVVRKGSERDYQTWQMRDGVAIGWRKPSAYDEGAEPDHRRRLINKQLLPADAQKTAYSGELTHPMHSRLVRDTQQRNRTLVYGYVPLSGSVEANLIPADERESTQGSVYRVDGQLAEQEWPFGAWNGISDAPICDCQGSLTELDEDLNEHFTWRDPTAYQINSSRQPTRAIVGFIRTLVERYQIFDESQTDNQALRTLCQRLIFNRPLGAPIQGASIVTLLDYLTEHQNELLDYFTEQVDPLERSLAKANETRPFRYPALPGAPGYLYISERRAREARELMVLRAERAEQLIESSLPLPRYTQGENDQYFIKPFVRYRDECGCERIAWGQGSQVFRVVSPLDAQATRPTAIQLPELSDLKKGFTKGVTFLTPKSMADALESIVPDMEFKKQNKKSRFSACLGLSISFSIPIITICAMILLMIVLNLLNLIFRWLPWAILVLPRQCKK